MSVLAGIVKKAVDKTCAPNPKVLEELATYLDESNKHKWVEDVLNISTPSDISLLVVITNKDELTDKVKYKALMERMTLLEETIRETYSGDAKITLYTAIRVYNTSCKFQFDLKTIGLNEKGEVGSIDGSGLMLSDMTLGINEYNDLTIMRSRFTSPNKQVVYGKSRLIGPISKVMDKGYNTSAASISELADLSGQTPNDVSRFLNGKVIKPKESFLNELAKALEIPVEDITPKAK